MDNYIQRVLNLYKKKKNPVQATKNEIVTFLEQNNSEHSFFEGELKLWKKIK